MKKIYLLLMSVAISANVLAADLEFSGLTKDAIPVVPEASTGLEKIYVVNNLSGVAASFKSNSGSSVEWFKFNQSGGGFVEPVASKLENGVSTLSTLEGNCGYIVKEGNRQFAFWVVDYSAYYFNIESIGFDQNQDCGVANLNLVADCNPIQYYTINGVPKQLDRKIEISYDTQVWNQELLAYETQTVVKQLSNISNSLVVQAPLCNTIFTISGDCFLSAWGVKDVVASDTYQTKSIEAYTVAEQAKRDNPNEVKPEGETLGGSAPAEITFTAFCSDAVEFKEWQFSKTADFSDIIFKMNTDEVVYTFDEEGTVYVKFVYDNADGTCLAEGDVYNVTIGESMIDCPNAFSPNATEGINDEWKVSYKSIVSFQCWIFDRYGNKIIQFDDPALGWDGKHKGKFVKPGVYFYVIEAVGADGKEYKMKGDINILKSNK